MSDSRSIVIGAGPAGLAAADTLAREGLRPLVLERAAVPGGIARTEQLGGYLFDVGGHRFFTKIEPVEQLWRELLGDDLLEVSRLSRIYYRRRFYHYPLRIGNALRNLGPVESAHIIWSYLAARLHRAGPSESFEQWVIKRFGRRLYQIFFQTYTEKVWGRPGNQIHADWAAQRIQGLSLMRAVWNALFGSQHARSLIGEFLYPRRGPGMMWERLAERIQQNGGEIRYGVEVAGLRRQGDRIVEVHTGGERPEVIPAASVISSVPMVRLVSLLQPAPPPEVHSAAAALLHRSFLLVGLVVERADLFPDQWIYVHSPHVTVGRIQNPKNWSTDMVPDAGTTSVGMEYFCDEGDALWNKDDGALVDLAARELEALGLAPRAAVRDGRVIRQPFAYPVYSPGYTAHVDMLRRSLGELSNLQTIGRSGMHRYNNMDHSMMTGLRAAENALGADHDLWSINEEETYHEAASEEGAGARERALVRSFARMDKLAFATAVGIVGALALSAATLILVFRGGTQVGPFLSLLANYIPGYDVTIRGAAIAFGVLFVWGFLVGWLIAYMRNLLLALYVYRAKRRAELLTLKDFIDQF